MPRTHESRFIPIADSSVRVLPDPCAIPAPTPVDVVFPPRPVGMVPLKIQYFFYKKAMLQIHHIKIESGAVSVVAQPSVFRR